MVQNTLISFENNTSQDRKILFKKPTVFNLQGQVLLQQPQQSCNNFHGLHLESCQGNAGKHPALQLKVAQGHSGCRLFLFSISASFPALHHSWTSLPGAKVGHLLGCSPAEKEKLSCAAVWKGPPKDRAHQILDLKLLGFRNKG